MKSKYLILLIVLLLLSCNFPISPLAQEIHTETPSQTPTQTPSPTPTSTPTLTPTSSQTPEPTQTPRPTRYEVKEGDTLAKIAELFQIPTGYLAAINKISDPNLIYIGQILEIPVEYIPLTPTPIVMIGNKMIYVVLSEQKVYAYEDGILLADFLISSGLPNTPTVTGKYLIQTKLESTTMSGPGYHLTHVPYVMYFYRGYSFHGTYWHENFGTPMSHGCLNMRTQDAEWLYYWAEIGTPVQIVP